MEQCEQARGADMLEVRSKALLENLIEIVNEIRSGRRAAAKETHAQQSIQQESGSDEYSSEESSGEDEFSQQQQTESVEALQAELTRLEISEEASTLETLVIIVEHFVKTNDVENFRKSVRRPDMWLLNQPRPKISDLVAMAENLEKQELPFRALMMYKAVCALYKYEYKHHPCDDDPPDAITPDMAVTAIEETMGKVFDIFNSIFNNDAFEIYLVHFVPIMHDMLTNLREIRHADRKYKADLEAWGMLYICIVFGRLQNAVEMHDVAVTIAQTTEKRFKKKAQKYMVYGAAMFGLSISKFLKHDGESAVTEYAEKALKAFQESKRLSSWDDKVKLVSKAEHMAQKIESMAKS